MVLGEVGSCRPSQDQIKGEREWATAASLMRNRVTFGFDTDDIALFKASGSGYPQKLMRILIEHIPDPPGMIVACDVIIAL